MVPISIGRIRCTKQIISQKGQKMISIKNFLIEEDGPTAVEYAVMLALIIVVCLVAVTSLGSKASTNFNYVSKTIGT